MDDSRSSELSTLRWIPHLRPCDDVDFHKRLHKLRARTFSRRGRSEPATFFNNGTKVVFTDELGGGSPTCNPTIGPSRGADAIYDISDPTNPIFLSYYKIPRTQSNKENCVAHNGMFLPTPDRDIYVQSWYQGGTSFVDMSDARNPREIGFSTAGRFHTDRAACGKPSCVRERGRSAVERVLKAFLEAPPAAFGHSHHFRDRHYCCQAWRRAFTSEFSTE